MIQSIHPVRLILCLLCIKFVPKHTLTKTFERNKLTFQEVSMCKYIMFLIS